MLISRSAWYVKRKVRRKISSFENIYLSVSAFLLLSIFFTLAVLITLFLEHARWYQPSSDVLPRAWRLLRVPTWPKRAQDDCWHPVAGKNHEEAESDLRSSGEAAESGSWWRFLASGCRTGTVVIRTATSNVCFWYDFRHPGISRKRISAVIRVNSATPFYYILQVIQFVCSSCELLPSRTRCLLFVFCRQRANRIPSILWFACFSNDELAWMKTSTFQASLINIPVR